jgi:nucleotide-binding universal stress UspA family protein
MSRIVVGMDASDNAARALRWALRQAKLTGADLELVHAFQASDTTVLPGSARNVGDDELRQAAEQTVREALKSAQNGEASDVHCTITVAAGSPASVLCRAGEGADLVVVGARGLGGFRGLLIGSVSHQVVGHAPCPVVVVTPEARGR